MYIRHNYLIAIILQCNFERNIDNFNKQSNSKSSVQLKSTPNFVFSFQKTTRKKNCFSSLAIQRKKIVANKIWHY